MEIGADAAREDGTPLEVACQASDAPGTWVLSVTEAPPGSQVAVTVHIEGAGWAGGEWQPLDPEVVVTGAGSVEDPLSLRAEVGPAQQERTFAVHGRPGPIVLIVRLRAGDQPPAPGGSQEHSEEVAAPLSAAAHEDIATEARTPAPDPVSPERMPEHAAAAIAVPTGNHGAAATVEPATEAPSATGAGRAIALAVVITAVAVAVGWGLVAAKRPVGGEARGQPPRELALVPDCYGLAEDSALGELRRVGLDWTTSREPSSTVGRGRVISQQPFPGTQASVGDSVRLVISTGSQRSSGTEMGGLEVGQLAVYRDRDRDNLHIREGPGTDRRIIGKLPYGGEIRVLAIDNTVHPGWVRGEVIATGEVGWMACRNPNDGYQLIKPK